MNGACPLDLDASTSGNGPGSLFDVTDESIAVLRVDDAALAVSWYERLGFVKEWEHHFDPSLPAFVSVARSGTARLFLSEHRGDARPDTLIYLRVPDIDAIASEFGSEIIDQPWGRELHLTDPDGNRVRVGTPRT